MSTADTYTLADIFPGYTPGEIMIDQLLYGSDDDHPAKAYEDESEPELKLYSLDEWPDVEPSGPAATRMVLDTYDYYSDDYRITKRAGIVRLHVRGRVAATGARAMRLRYEIAEHWTPIPRPVHFRTSDWGERAEARRTRFYSWIADRAVYAAALLDGTELDAETIDRFDLDDKTPDELDEIIENSDFYNYPEAGQWEYQGIGTYSLRDAYNE